MRCSGGNPWRLERSSEFRKVGFDDGELRGCTVVVLSLFRDVAVHIQHQFKIVNAKFCDEVSRKRQWPAFTGRCDRWAAGEPFPDEFHAVHQDRCIDIVVGFGCPHVGKLSGHGHGFTGVGLSRVEGQAPVVQRRRKVGTLVRHKGVSEQDVKVAITVDVRHGGRGPHSVGHAEGR